MIVIGLTGGSGVGKSCVCQSFLKFNINSIDTDRTSREVCSNGMPCLNELVDTFGKSILTPDGSLDRPALAKLAFSDKIKHAQLNKITHYHILNQVRIWLDGQRSEGRIAAIVDAPLLFESGFDKECDLVIAVTAPRDQRINRLLKRDNIPLEAIELRLSKQGDDDFYTKRSHFVIQNNGSLIDIDRQVQSIYNQLFPTNTTE